MSYNELKQHGTLDFPIQLYHIDKNHPKFEMASHWHTNVEIIRILNGSLKVILDNHELSANSGEVIFVNSETVHSAFPSPDCVYECIVLNLEMLLIEDAGCRYFIESVMNLEFRIDEYFSSENDAFTQAVGNLFEAMQKKSSGHKFNIIGSLYQLIGIIIDNHNYHSSRADTHLLKDKNIPKLKKVLSFIRSNYDSQISLEDMAEVAGMSSRYFCSFFKKMTLKTPMEYLKTYRIERAARKLLNSDMNITEIAFSSGFNDLSYFIKTFKEIKGVTPAAFRNS